MKSIGFKNFRKFEDFPSIELGDVTYLVGQNNAGKSTMVKAAILVLENLKQKDLIPFGNEAYFSFVTPVHDLHIETFERALHHGSAEKRIKFSVSLGDFDFEITVVPDDAEVLYNFNQDDNTRVASINTFIVKDNKLGVRLEIHPFINKYVLEFDNAKSSSTLKTQALIDEVNGKITELEESLKNAPNSMEKVSLVSLDLKAKLEELQRYQKRLANRLKAGLKTKLVFNSLYLAYPQYSESMYSIVREIEAFKSMAKYDKSNKKARFSSLSLGLSEKEKKQQGQSLTKLRKYAEVLGEMADRLNSILYSIDVAYMPAHLATQDSVLNSHTKDIFAKVVDEYVHRTEIFDRDGHVYRFIKRWMDKDHFNIGKEFNIKEVLPGYYTLNIDTYDNGVMQVGDMGMGTNQLMILLLHIANKMRYARKTNNMSTIQEDNEAKRPFILIEEPEQNLHPNLQSKLADFIYELANNYGMQFVIETHSEYIIRQNQVIVKGLKFKDQKDVDGNCALQVYYFTHDGAPYSMEFKPSGHFKQSFEHGFFDIAGLLAFRLSDYEQTQNEDKSFDWTSL